ncbi:MAG: hypothetical protein OEU76_04880, partial [Cyclobacteriaceae bacterium]|nr:hypothetical protein [Cyclobacteriaceae bacterium]
MKQMRLIIVLCISLLFSLQTSAQKKYDKALAKADKSYTSGKYSSAISALEKFKKMVVAKLGTNNKYMPGYYLREARYNLAYGILTGFEGSLTQAQNVSSGFYGENTLNHANTLVDIAQIYNDYGYYRLSREILKQTSNILIQSGQEDPALKSKLVLTTAEAM